MFICFYKTEWQILFAYCKHNVCCFRVNLPNLNQVQWSKISARQFEWFCTTCTISQLLGTMETKIVVVVERECVLNKRKIKKENLRTNRLQETLVLAQNTQNNEKIKILWKASLLTLTNDLFCFITSFLHQPASLYREGSIREENILRYSFRTEMQPRSHRLADL